MTDIKQLLEKISKYFFEWEEGMPKTVVEHEDGGYILLSDVENAFHELLKENEQLKNQWVSVFERLPEKTQTKYLVLNNGFISLAEYWEPNRWVELTSFNESGITHWMPLPEPPKDTE